MALTSDYHDIVQARIRRDPEFRECLLNGTVERLLAGEVVVARIKLRDYIIATVGFEQLGAMTGESPESLIEMFGPEGDPGSGSLFEVIACILRHEGLVLQISTVPGEFGVDDPATTESAAAR
ncbi:MAG: hypothetical protein OXC06_14650 [Acidimicrobiaceae bacterium]|nr:hypothetical protein [Acidimicrobiaceae bacterium]